MFLDDIKMRKLHGSFDVRIMDFRDIDDFHCTLISELPLLSEIENNLQKDFTAFDIMKKPIPGESLK
jgi:hypothetical protein